MTESNMADGLYKTLQNKIKSEPRNPYHYSDLAMLYWQVDEEVELAQQTFEAGFAAAQCLKKYQLF